MRHFNYKVPVTQLFVLDVAAILF